MFTIKKTLIISATALLVSACMTTPEVSRIENRYEPEVTYSRFAHPLNGGDTESKIASAHSFLRAFDARYGDVVVVRGGDTSDRTAFASSLTRSLPGLRVVAAQGNGTAPMSLLLERAIAVSPSCGDWSRQASKSGGQADVAGLGCSTSAALAQMVADPRDLKGGRGSNTADSEIYADVIRAVREERFDVTVSDSSTTGSE